MIDPLFLRVCLAGALVPVFGTTVSLGLSVIDLSSLHCACGGSVASVVLAIVHACIFFVTSSALFYWALRSPDGNNCNEMI
jgi:hypothetical protein